MTSSTDFMDFVHFIISGTLPETWTSVDFLMNSGLQLNGFCDKHDIECARRRCTCVRMAWVLR